MFEAYANIGKLDQHKFKMHKLAKIKTEPQQFQCEQCAKTFKNRSSLKIHIDSKHKGIANFKCDSCSKTFYRKDQADHHFEKVHNSITISNHN